MSLYLGTTEITKLRDLAPQTGLDITDLWFGSKNVFTVWAEYEGTLPATINANGDDMRQYQIYGNTGGVGDRTVQLFDLSTSTRGKYIAADGSEGTSAMGDPFKQLNHSDFIEIRNGEEYYFSYYGDTLTGGQTLAMCWFDSSKTLITRKTQSVSSGVNTYVINDTAPSNAKYLIINFAAWNNNSHYMLTEGSAPPASYVPFGYEVDIGVKSGNIYNSAETSWSADGTVLNDSGEPISLEGSHYTTNFIPCEPAEVYYLAGSLANETRWRVYFYDANKNWIRRTGSKSPGSTRLIEMNENARYFQLQVGTDIVSTSDWNFVHSLTAPTKYQPYYNITTPMYIGDEPLGKDEYIDYQTQKVYRMINGTLTPTDPPVALPSLPTCEGKTVIDYAGESVAQPEKVVLEYKKGGN